MATANKQVEFVRIETVERGKPVGPNLQLVLDSLAEAGKGMAVKIKIENQKERHHLRSSVAQYGKTHGRRIGVSQRGDSVFVWEVESDN